MESNHKFKIGDKVKVKKEVLEPKQGWGPVTHKSIGKVYSINDDYMKIEFPEYRHWGGFTEEMELVEPVLTAEQLVDSLDQHIEKLERKLNHAN